MESINQNTSEIQSFQGLLSEIGVKVDKLSERLDELELVVNPSKSKKFDVKLTPREQEVFMALYMGKLLSAVQIAKMLGFTEDMVNMYVFNIMSKGVPVRRELVDDVLIFSLDPAFKDMQARRNVLEIDPVIAKQIALHKL